MQAGPHWGMGRRFSTAGAEDGVARVMFIMGQLRAQRPQRVQREASAVNRAGFIFTARNQG